EGAFYVFPDISGTLGRRSPAGRHIATDTDFCESLLDEAGVALVPGAAFGLSPHLRLSYAADDDTLARACARVADFCNSLR
ncbi:MAG: aminotransferase class I/II-fold pyridoxal phosphate-dependent enzyme, partial [Rhodobacteraceae bacterium]|nr:aminotransferase class I/II-fold pyridoxal phosphate-dependent enzyme [Paracoccaceae bacterium]